MRPASALPGAGPEHRQRRAGGGITDAREGVRRLDDRSTGRATTKSNTMRMNAFTDGASGLLGLADGDARL
jgi:hypothetical protein